MSLMQRMKQSMKRITNKRLDQILARNDEESNWAIFFDLIPFDKASEKLVESLFKMADKELDKKYYIKANELIKVIKERPYTFINAPN